MVIPTFRMSGLVRQRVERAQVQAPAFGFGRCELAVASGRDIGDFSFQWEAPKSESQIRFDDGAAYERRMGVWSRLVGEEFLAWLAPRKDQSWIDVGCGNGAFTELLVERCAPSKVVGVDPSEGPLEFARSRLTAGVAEFRSGQAT